MFFKCSKKTASHPEKTLRVLRRANNVRKSARTPVCCVCIKVSAETKQRVSLLESTGNSLSLACLLRIRRLASLLYVGALGSIAPVC